MYKIAFDALLLHRLDSDSSSETLEILISIDY